VNILNSLRYEEIQIWLSFDSISAVSESLLPNSLATEHISQEFDKKLPSMNAKNTLDCRSLTLTAVLERSIKTKIENLPFDELMEKEKSQMEAKAVEKFVSCKNPNNGHQKASTSGV